ncbi:hypothetical protein [Oceanimonas sp. CAM02]|uniref:hypothetical protein n=1 Tax=Oceanimonas sp. CAM02 TaxID=3080336 RepID=UPI0029368F4B|nr:hypothetical protein [Oceanimonas sp. CAM02]MDV2858278.1 hypothetical protein [Oceanimonas sp. CAM02]
MNKDFSKSNVFCNPDLPLVEKLKLWKNRQQELTDNFLSCNFYDDISVRDGRLLRKYKSLKELEGKEFTRKLYHQDKNLKKLKKHTGFVDVSEGMLSFLFADFLVSSHATYDAIKFDRFNIDEVVLGMSKYCRETYGIRVGAVGLKLPDYDDVSRHRNSLAPCKKVGKEKEDKLDDRQFREIFRSAFHAVALIDKACKCDGRVMGFTLSLPNEFMMRVLNKFSSDFHILEKGGERGLEIKKNLRTAIVRKIVERMKGLKGNFLFSIEFGRDKNGKEDFHNPHIHGLVIIPSDGGDMARFEEAKSHVKSMMIDAVGKSNNAWRQFKWSELYSCGWMSYMGKDYKWAIENLGGSSYYCPDALRGAAKDIYELVSQSLIDPELVRRAHLDTPPAARS